MLQSVIIFVSALVILGIILAAIIEYSAKLVNTLLQQDSIRAKNSASRFRTFGAQTKGFALFTSLKVSTRSNRSNTFKS